jgi:hypothetical protein
METSRQHPLNKTEIEGKKVVRTGSGVCAMAGSGIGGDEVSGYSRTLLVSVASSSVQSALYLN